MSTSIPRKVRQVVSPSVPISYVYMDHSNFSVLFSDTGVCIIACTYVCTLVISVVCFLYARSVACWDDRMCACVISVAGAYVRSFCHMYVFCMCAVAETVVFSVSRERYPRPSVRTW